MKIKNTLGVPVKLLKVNEYNLGTIAPNEELEITVDPETVEIELKTP